MIQRSRQQVRNCQLFAQITRERDKLRLRTIVRPNLGNQFFFVHIREYDIGAHGQKVATNRKANPVGSTGHNSSFARNGKRHQMLPNLVLPAAARLAGV